MNQTPYVIFVDDDQGIAKSMKFLLDAEKITSQYFESGEVFLDAIQKQPSLLEGPGCIFLDIRMKKISGLDVFEELKKYGTDSVMPIIFMTGHGDVPIVTRVLKEGAIDFLQKPIPGDELLKKVEDYFEISNNLWSKKQQRISVEDRLASLTSKEFLIMKHLYTGESNKDIAEQLGNSVRTVELRRAAIYDKLRVRSVVEMVRILEGIQLDDKKQAALKSPPRLWS